MPIDNLKIDRSFINEISTETESLELVKTIITLAHTLGMDAIAEGIETPEQAKILKSLNCKYAQGYLFSKPLPTKAVESMIKNDLPNFQSNVIPIKPNVS